MNAQTDPTASDWLSDANGNRAGVEYWLPIPGYQGSYEVSSVGRIRSLDRLNINRNGVRRILRGKILCTPRDSEGYLQVSLLRNGAQAKARVHRIVATVFVKNPHDLPLVDHRNRNRTDSAVSNLRWVDHSGNRSNMLPSRFYGRNEAAMEDMRRLAQGDL